MWQMVRDNGRFMQYIQSNRPRGFASAMFRNLDMCRVCVVITMCAHRKHAFLTWVFLANSQTAQTSVQYNIVYCMYGIFALAVVIIASRCCAFTGIAYFKMFHDNPAKCVHLCVIFGCSEFGEYFAMHI